jgi:DNA-binding NarL/FixJ family response regulator
MTPKPRIAFIEDEPSFHDALKQFLSSPETEAFATFVGSYFSAEAALEAIPALVQPDVLLVDVQLPAMSGIEAVRILKERRSAMEMMMLTTQDDSAIVFEALKAGAVGYVLKTATLADIRDHIHVLLSGGAPMSPAISRQVLQYFHAAPAASTLTTTLTERERDVLNLLTKGYRHRDIATRLAISPETVRTHIKHVYEKLHVHSRTELIEKMSA